MNRVGGGRNRCRKDQQYAENHAGRSRRDVNEKDLTVTFICEEHYDVP